MKPDRFILILLAVSFLIGMLTLTHYGESWDDYSLRKYADYSLRTYETWRMQGLMPITDKDLGNYGPAYMMTVLLGSRLLNNFLPLNPADSRHIFYFITHLAGVWAFYELAKRWLSRNATRYATLLYATQPLFWGHSFMNPKDTPFLAFFMLSLLFGLRMIDSLNATQTPQSDSPRWLRVTIALGVVAILGLFATTNLIHGWLDQLVRAASSGQTNIISYLASDLHKVKPEIYIQRYFVFFLWARAAFFILFILFTIYQLPNSYRRILFTILFPAFLLGYTTSIRVIAPFVGVLVSLYALRVLGKKSIPILITYALITIAFTYITWPYLWSDPIGHFIESLQTMSKYPWFGQVLFDGVQYDPTKLPYSYLPVLLAVQLTEPIWILFFVGLGKLIYETRRPKDSKAQSRKFSDLVTSWLGGNELLILTLLWLILPLIGFIVMRVELYDNFRQIFFILPPVFLVAGLGMESILARLTKPVLRIVLACVLLLPGIIAGIRLHPYEYVYYNSLVQNPNGRFELDYWAISYREAAEFVNTVAPPNSKIMVEGPGQAAELYVRPDLTVLSDDVPTTEPFKYAIVTTRNHFDQQLFTNGKVVYQIERNGMILTVIKKIE